MEIYLTSVSGERIQIPILPDRVTVKTGAYTISTTIINLGETRIPRGTMLTGYSWDGVLPGRNNLSYISAWQEPVRIIGQLASWLEDGETLRLMITGTAIDDDVFLDNFTYEPFGGAGDYYYSVTFTHKRKILVDTVPAQAIDNAAQTDGGQNGVVTLNNKSSKAIVRQKASSKSKSIGKLNNGTSVQVLSVEGSWYKIPFGDTQGYVLGKWILLTGALDSDQDALPVVVPAHESVYTVKEGDTLYTISKATLGSGSRYKEIYKLNKSAIDKRNKGKNVNRYTVYTGMNLQLP